MDLKLSEVKVFSSPNSKVNIGFGTATFNEGLAVRFVIRKSKVGAEFVSWPQSSYEKDGKTTYTNEVSFVSKEVAETINNEIIKEFNKKVGISSTQASSDGGPAIEDTDNSASNTAVVTPTKTKKTRPPVSWK